MAIGLKTHIWNNNLKSLLLLVSYPFLVAGIVWCVFFGVHYTFLPELATSGGYFTGGYEGAVKAQAALDRSQGAAHFATASVLAYWPAIVTFVAVWFIIAYFLQTWMIRAISHAHPVTREQEPELYNLLENLCISRGMTMPKLEVIETRARNAFASGIDKKSYRITVTRGLLQSLQKDEVEAVLGHELTHIKNGDVRLLIVSIIFTGMIGFMAQMAWSSIRYSHFSRRRDGRLVFVLLAVAAILWLGYLATLFTRFALSRRREYMADAGSIELTKNPDAMMRALLRLSGKDKIPEATDDIALMCIENSRKFLGLFDTHPPIEERIRTISELTKTPIPEIKPGHRTEKEERFTDPQTNDFPWLTATRRDKKKLPWT